MLLNHKLLLWLIDQHPYWHIWFFSVLLLWLKFQLISFIKPPISIYIWRFVSEFFHDSSHVSLNFTYLRPRNAVANWSVGNRLIYRGKLLLGCFKWKQGGEEALEEWNYFMLWLLLRNKKGEEKFIARGKGKHFEKVAGQGLSAFFFFFSDCQSLSVLGRDRKLPPCVALKMAEEQQNYNRKTWCWSRISSMPAVRLPDDNCGRAARSQDSQQIRRNQKKIRCP